MKRTVHHLRWCPRCLQNREEVVTVFEGVSTRLTTWDKIYNIYGDPVEVCPDCYQEALRWKPVRRESR